MSAERGRGVEGSQIILIKALCPLKSVDINEKALLLGARARQEMNFPDKKR